MEVVIAVFLGLWLSCASFLAFRQLKKDFKENVHDREGKDL